MKRHHFLFVAAFLAFLSGCTQAVRTEGRPYPGGRALETLDIQVERDETVLLMTNTSARAFGPCTVWVNASYSMPIDGFPIGDSLRLELGAFVDEFDNHFRAGGFFATRRPDDVVLVEIEDEQGARFGLITIRGEGE